MNEETTNPQKEKNTKNRDAITLKILLIGVLIVVLIIPMLMIQNLISEREDTAKDATNEVQQKWSGPQTIIGPILTLSRSLEELGYIECRKQFIGRRPNTTFSVTEKGREAFAKHLNALEEFLQNQNI